MRLGPKSLAVLLWAASSQQSPTKRQEPVSKQPPRSYVNAPLTFTEDGKFQVSIFEDLHFGENAWDSWGPQQDINSVKVINEVLDKESPGLVVLNGDLITGNNAFLENGSVYVDQIVAPLVERGLTWASTYGNHDSDFNLSSADVLAREQRWPNARTQSMVPGLNAGVSNYYLPVYDHGCSDTTCVPQMLLWFFDSRGGFYFQKRNPDGSQVPQPGWVDFSVVEWFQSMNHIFTRRYSKVIPSLAFVHIPTNASFALQAENGRDSIDPHRQPGINDDFPLAQQAQGWCSNGTSSSSCSYGGQDVPFMEALTTTPGLIAVFSGHDHGDTWCYKWDRLVPGMTVAGNGINLCFGQHSGYGGYGSWIRGARQVQVSLDSLKKQVWEADTWIRLESGDVVGSVSLNSTYGKDVYPVTPNDMTHCPTCNYSATMTEWKKKLQSQ